MTITLRLRFEVSGRFGGIWPTVSRRPSVQILENTCRRRSKIIETRLIAYGPLYVNKPQSLKSEILKLQNWRISKYVKTHISLW